VDQALKTKLESHFSPFFQNNVIGLLFVKDLIFIDPEDETPVRGFVQIFGRGVHVVWPDDKLGDVLAELKQGRSHLALVRDVNNTDDTQDPYYEMKGIITLEDIIEKIIGDTIVDETDAFVDNSQRIKVDRGQTFEWAKLRLLDAKIVDQFLSLEEIKAVRAHLRVNFPKAVELLTDSQLHRLVAGTPVSLLATATQELAKELPNDLLYEKGVHSDACTLILGGKVTVFVGADKFRSDVASWSLLGVAALADPSYQPDFSAFVSDGPCRCLRLTHAAFAEAVDASALERRLATDSQSDILSHPLSLSASSLDASAQFEVAELPTVQISEMNRREKILAALHPTGTQPVANAAHLPSPSTYVRYIGGFIPVAPPSDAIPSGSLVSHDSSSRVSLDDRPNRIDLSPPPNPIPTPTLKPPSVSSDENTFLDQKPRK
jgi:hypothetical protein